MYATCLFCNSDLGRNEVIESFPIGRRLAFDAARGRLWVVCRKCERWNLTPLDERWEAIEACEREFRGTKLRVSTEEIGLARVKEGLELVRIGAPQRPEMAAWRYGDQFGKRRTRSLILGAASAAAVGGYVIAGPLLGLVGLGAMWTVNAVNLARSLYRSHSIAAHVPDPRGVTLVIPRSELELATLLWNRADKRWGLELSHRPLPVPGRAWWKLDPQRETALLLGDDAIGAARLILPSLNAAGARHGAVQEAVGYLEESPRPEQLFARAARSFARDSNRNWWNETRVVLKTIPTTVRLALEMSANEETERRALEGELYLLEDAWRDAEEIAGIADDMFLPASVDDELARLKRLRDERNS